jgi:hypothetical protein
VWNGLRDTKKISFFKDAVFWDVAPCRSCVNRRFGGKYRLHLQDRKISERGTSVSRCLRYVPPKRRFTQDLHGATSQKTAFFIVTAVETSNLTISFMVLHKVSSDSVGLNMADNHKCHITLDNYAWNRFLSKSEYRALIYIACSFTILCKQAL